MSRLGDIIRNMSIITIEQLKAKFESGDWPRSTDYMDLIDTLAALPESGTSVLNGSGVPSSETGLNGDFILILLIMIFMDQKLQEPGDLQHL
jgi:hypothetical protein